MAGTALAFVFPGQGSQKIGMLTEAYDQFGIVRNTFAEANDALGYNLWDLVKNGPQEALNLTETTQPLMLTSSVALWRAWTEKTDALPSIMAGHSLGEFSALVCAGALEFVDAVKLVRQRGAFMQAAVAPGEGAMAAIIGLDDSEINRICLEITGEGNQGLVAAVNFNSPGQVVIAGHTAAVEVAITALKSAGAKRAMSLPVSAPFHTSLMEPAGVQLAEALAEVSIRPPTIPVVNNVYATIETGPEKIRALLVEQISRPVQWTACMAKIIGAGATALIECGPGTVLSGLAKRIDKNLKSFSLEEPDSLTATIDAVCAAKGTTA